jgi:hypothetical protein
VRHGRSTIARRPRAWSPWSRTCMTLFLLAAAGDLALILSILFGDE